MVEKKFYDIFPPDQIPEEEKPRDFPEKEPVPEEPVVTNPVPRQQIQPIKPPVQNAPAEISFAEETAVPPKKLKIGSLVFALSLLLLAAALFAKYLPRVTIDVWVKTALQTARQDLAVNKGLSEPDFAGLKLPGTVFSEEKLVSRDFPSSGKVVAEAKASGVIRVFNNYSTADQPLMTNTRFISNEGKLFRLAERTVVPGQKSQAGKTVPGFVDAKIVADAAGPEYNIGPSTFSIPGFVGTAKYTAFYAQSFASMTGGFQGQKNVVTEQDLAAARQVLEQEAAAQIEETFRNKSLPGFVLVKEDSGPEVIEESSLAKAGDSVDNFTYQLKAKETAVLVAEKDLNQMGRNYLLSQIEPGEKIVDGTFKITPSIKSVDTQAGRAALSLETSAKTYLPLDGTADLRAQLARKPLSEVAQNLEDMSQVLRAKISIFPSFFNNLPQDPNKININLKFE